MTDLAVAPPVVPPSLVRRRSGVRVVLLWELEKLVAHARVRLALLVCLLGPFLFAAALRLTDSLPADTLFGRWLHDSGFAVPLVVLGFATSWGFPILTGIVACDVVASEDAAGTWPMLLTRSTGRGAIFWGKTLAVAAYVVAVLVVLAGSSLAAGVLLVGAEPLVGLSGNVLAGSTAVWLVLLAWVSVVPPCLALAAFGLLLSVLTRNGVAALVGTVVVGVCLQLVTLVDGLGPVRDLLVGSHLLAWHLLFTEPRSTGPLLLGTLVSLGYAAALTVAAWAVLVRRDMSGA